MFEIVFGVILGGTLQPEYIGGLVVGDGRFIFGLIISNDKIAADMDTRTIDDLTALYLFCDAYVAVHDIQVGSAEIQYIPVTEEIITAFYGVAPYAVAVQDVYLHSVIRGKEMVPAAHYLMGAVVEQLIGIEFKYLFRGEIIIEHLTHYVYGIGDVDAVIPEIDETDPFFERQWGTGAVIKHAHVHVTEKKTGLGVRPVGRLAVFKAAEAYVLAPEGYGGTVKNGTVLSF